MPSGQVAGQKIPENFKWYLVGSPDQDWYNAPVEAVSEVAAIEAVETDGLELGSTYYVYEVVNPGPAVLKTSIELIPALK